MQTNFTEAQLRDPDTASSNAILRTCVHCGFCTATCPTFLVLGDELDSPRGRIYLAKDMLEAGRPAPLDRIETAAGSLAPRSTDPLNFGIIQRHVERIVLVSDPAMQQAAAWLWFEHGVASELGGAAAVAALLTGAYQPRPGERVCAVICGAGTDGMAG